MTPLIQEIYCLKVNSLPLINRAILRSQFLFFLDESCCRTKDGVFYLISILLALSLIELTLTSFSWNSTVHRVPAIYLLMFYLIISTNLTISYCNFQPVNTIFTLKIGIYEQDYLIIPHLHIITFICTGNEMGEN